MLGLLESYRRDRRFPIDDLLVARSCIRYLVDVLRRIQQAIDDMPQELRKPVYTHAPPEPIRRPGASILSLDFVQQHQQQRQQHTPLLQAIGFDAATQTALGNHLSATSPWPWPAETFTLEGLPNEDARSSNNSNSSSANHSPRLGGDSNLAATREGPSAGLVEGGRPTHHSLTLPPGLQTQTRSNAGNNDILVDPTAASAGGLTMMDLVNVFHPSPAPSSTPVLSPMCTMHANIVATESLIRFLVTEYRQLVSTRIHDLRLGQVSPCSAPEEFGGEEWQEAAQNMLRVFNSLPLDALASNGHSLVSKIIYVLSALLDRTATATGVGRDREGKSGKRGGTTTTVGFQYMSSLLGTLTRLSQTRKDDNASEWWSGEQEEEQDGRSRANDNGGGGGGGGGDDDDDGGEASGRRGQRRRNDGNSSGQGRSGNSDAGGNNANRRPSGPQLDPSTHSDNGSRGGRDISSTRNRNLTAAGGGVGSKQLAPPLTMPQQQQHQEAPFSPYTFSNQSSSNPSSTTSSTTNTASTTPTSEQPAPAPPSSWFYDDPKLVNCTTHTRTSTALGTQKGMQST